MDESYDNPEFGNEPEIDPTLPSENEQPKESSNQNPPETKQDPPENQTNPDEEGKELCPYCGQPLDQQLIDGQTWYIHKDKSKCQATFQGIDKLKEARAEKQRFEEARQKEEEARIAKEEAEKPFREAAQKTAEFTEQIIQKQLSEIQQKYEAQLDKMQEEYKKLLEDQQKTISQAQERIAALIQADKPATLPDRGVISNAIAAYKEKLNQCAADDPNSQTYEYLEKRFNDLLIARDQAEKLVNITSQNIQTIKKRLDENIQDVRTKMEDASSDGKEYETIQKEIMEHKQGIIYVLEKQLENLERLFFRRS